METEDTLVYCVNNILSLYPIQSQSNPLHVFTLYLRPILILFSHLWLSLPNGFFPLRFPTNVLISGRDKIFLLTSTPRLGSTHLPFNVYRRFFPPEKNGRSVKLNYFRQEFGTFRKWLRLFIKCVRSPPTWETGVKVTSETEWKILCPDLGACSKLTVGLFHWFILGIPSKPSSSDT